MNKLLSITRPVGMSKANVTWTVGENGFGSEGKFPFKNGNVTVPKYLSRSCSYGDVIGGKDVSLEQRRGLYGEVVQIEKVDIPNRPEHNRVVTQIVEPIDKKFYGETSTWYENGTWRPLGMKAEYGVVRPNSDMIKTTTITSPTEAFPEYKSVQIQRADGFYSSSRVVGKKVVGGYEVIPEQRKFAQGFKGKLQRLALSIGSDANGCERPVLRRIAGFIFRRIK